MGNGLMVPTVYERVFTDVKGETVAAAIAVGVSADPRRPGLAFTHSGRMTGQEATLLVADMVREGMAIRRRDDDFEIITVSSESTGSSGWYAAVAALLYADEQISRMIESGVSRSPGSGPI